jgi:hypothetical protein
MVNRLNISFPLADINIGELFMRVRNFKEWPMSSDKGAGQPPGSRSAWEIRPGRMEPSNGANPESVYSSQLYPRRTTRIHRPESRLSENRITEALSRQNPLSDDPLRAGRLVDIRIKIALGYYDTPCHLQELADILVEKLSLDRSGDW